jgi:hypothetical protein
MKICVKISRNLLPTRFSHDFNIFRTDITDNTSHLQYPLPQIYVTEDIRCGVSRRRGNSRAAPVNVMLFPVPSQGTEGDSPSQCRKQHLPEACARRSALLSSRTPDRWLGLSHRREGIVPEESGVTLSSLQSDSTRVRQRGSLIPL